LERAQTSRLNVGRKVHKTRAARIANRVLALPVGANVALGAQGIALPIPGMVNVHSAAATAPNSPKMVAM
jgi:hypothetical protein